IPPTPLAPMPVQRPHPPIWMGGTADGALRRAARFGDGWLTDNMTMIEGMKERIATYRAFSEACGRPPGTVAGIRNARIAERRETVERDWLPGVIDYHLFNRANYRKAGMDGPDPDGVYARLEAGEAVGMTEFVRERVVAGTPDDCLEQIDLWRRETGCDS